jgi:alpha-tubulin suppressor-like RCC1 family protein
VPGLTGVAAVSAGGVHTCALLATHAVRCWGSNFGGALGDGTLIDRLSPVAVKSLADATAISAGGETTCAIRTGAVLACWGNNRYGQLGLGREPYEPLPVAVVGIGPAGT